MISPKVSVPRFFTTDSSVVLHQYHSDNPSIHGYTEYIRVKSTSWLILLTAEEKQCSLTTLPSFQKNSKCACAIK